MALSRSFIIDVSRPLLQPATDRFDLDLLTKGRPEHFPSSAASRPTWLTWTIESICEYCRIAWDVKPDYKVSIFSCGQQRNPLTIVPVVPLSADSPLPSPRLKNLRIRFIELAKASMSGEAPVNGSDVITVANAVTELRSLESEELLTAPLFRENLDKVLSTKPFFIRLVIVTSSRSADGLAKLIQECIIGQNLCYLARFEVAAILIGGRSVTDGPSYVKLGNYGEIFVRWYDIQNGFGLLEAMKNCITWDLRLSRTIITDIPMKEDAKSGPSTSFSYDVELFHPCLLDENRRMRPGGEVLRMKWVKPIRGPLPGFAPMEDTVPIRATPSDPTTRPTQCLVQYVVEGNAIFVESKSPFVAGKIFLCGGKISLQQLVVSGERVIDDFPALAELPGGRVASYRVKETVALLSAFPLDLKSFPLKPSIFDQQDRLTAYYPLVYSDTLVYLMPQLIGLFEFLNASTYTDDVYTAAKQSIEEVLEMERKSQALPNNPAHPLLQSVSSAQKRSEGYAIVWAELDLILDCHVGKSSKHAKLYSFFKSSLRKPVREDIRTALLDRVRGSAPQEMSVPDVTSSVPIASAPKKRKQRPDFEGRIKYGRYGKLYQNLQKPEKNDGGLIHASLEL